MGAAVELDAVLASLHPFLQPGTDLLVVDVHELGTDRSTVGCPHHFVNFFQRAEVLAVDRSGRKLELKIRLRQPIGLREEFGVGFSGTPQWINFCL